MAFSFPTLPELAKRIKSDIDNSLEVSGTSLKKSVVGALSKAMAGAVFLLYQFSKYVIKQFFIPTADIEWLLIWGEIFNVPRKTESFATGTVKIKGTDGIVVPAGTRMKIDDQFFTVDEDSEIGDSVTGEIDAIVTAEVAGSEGNVDEDEELVFVSSIEGVQSKAAVQVGGIAGGAAAEDVELYRQRILDRIQEPPHGGSNNDYIAWAKEVSGITRAWVYPQYLGQSNAVGVTFVNDDADPIIPNGAKVTEVQNHIDDDSRKPVTADVTAFAPIADPMNLTISLNPNTAAVQAAVLASIKSLIAREAEPGGAHGADGTIYLSRLNEAISVAVGEFDHVIDQINGGAPADVVPATANIVTLGVITWQNL